MLTVVLDRLTALASRYFVVGAFIPVLVFGFINGAILYAEFGWFRAWAAPQISATVRVFDVVVVLVGLAVAGYAMWSLSGYLREILEGRRLRPDSQLARRLRQQQATRLRELRTDYYQARDNAAQVADAHEGWMTALIQASVDGARDHPETNGYDGVSGPAAKALQDLRRRRADASPPPHADIDAAVTAFKAELARNDVNALHPASHRATLADDRFELYKLLDYAEDEWAYHEVALANRLQVRYGAGVAAATAFGNVAESIQSYALSRYGLNLATFWSRLQPLLQKHTDFYPVLQDAKVQVDFLVTSTVLTALTTAIWLIVLPVWTDAVWLFAVVAVLGPLITRMLYLAAVENYVAFGEVVRTSVDLYRFELLDALHLSRPNGLRDERALWLALQRIAAYGQDWVDLSYRHGTGGAS
jgi:hypothetical protein